MERHGQGILFDEIDPPQTDLLLDCVHCGLCLPTCPSYLILGTESDSPRGRIYLIRQAREGRLALTDSFVRHLDLCLACRACETACPSGVRFGPLIETARGQIARRYSRPLSERLLRFVLFSLFPSPERLSPLLFPLRLLNRLGILSLIRRSGLLHLLPSRLAQMVRLLPPLPPTSALHPLPEVVAARGKGRARVGLIAGCVQRLFLPRVNEATVAVLAENGCEVVIPREQSCCGALHVHGGEREAARAYARRNIDAFERAGVEAVLTNAAGCGAALKEYGELLQEDPVYAHRAELFSRKVQDVSQFLAVLTLTGTLHPLRRTVTYHDPCHLLHGQKVKAEPRALLQAIPDLTLVPLAESDLCCGSAGVYNLTEPEVSEALLQRKIDRIVATGAEIVATGNVGCLMQIGMGLRVRGNSTTALHPMELLAWSYGGGGRSALPLSFLSM